VAVIFARADGGGDTGISASCHDEHDRCGPQIVGSAVGAGAVRDLVARRQQP
jgi:hypothetical protein